jgi:hypothetical protein
MKHIITNRTAGDKYRQDGFCILGNLSNIALLQLEELYKVNFNAEETKGLYPTHYYGLSEKNVFISNQIYNICREDISTMFNEYVPLISHFVVKQKNFDSYFNLHQDWSVIDESKFEIVHLWIPLQDTNALNGGMFVIPKSHRLLNNYRSGSLGIPFLQQTPELKKYMVDTDLKKGTIFAYHPALFHGSSPNSLGVDRLAVIITLRHVDSELIYFHNNGKGKMEKYHISEETLLSELILLNESNQPQSGKFIDSDILPTLDNKNINEKLIIKLIEEIETKESV